MTSQRTQRDDVAQLRVLGEAFGVRVNSIAPGIFQTAMVGGMKPEIQASLEAQVPFPSRLGRPEEYARLVQSIFEIAMLNGETIRLDGAIRMQPK